MNYKVIKNIAAKKLKITSSVFLPKISNDGPTKNGTIEATTELNTVILTMVSNISC